MSYHAAGLILNSAAMLLSARPRVGKGGFSNLWDNRLPSLVRFLLIIGVLAALAWGGMYALVTFVEPQPREMTQTIPPSKFTGK